MLPRSVGSRAHVAVCVGSGVVFRISPGRKTEKRAWSRFSQICARRRTGVLSDAAIDCRSSVNRAAHTRRHFHRVSWVIAHQFAGAAYFWSCRNDRLARLHAA
jgi:hypothetical protein